jgi:hypothetical protein
MTASRLSVKPLLHAALLSTLLLSIVIPAHAAGSSMPWEAPLQFIENSPIFWVDKVQTPYLTIHNDEDDAVPWYQGIEFFSALRRLGKEAYFFNYNDERHGLRQRDNPKHYTVHLDEYFDHFLKGAPRPEWMEKGVPFLERGTRDVSELFKRKAPIETTQGAARM